MAQDKIFRRTGRNPFRRPHRMYDSYRTLKHSTNAKVKTRIAYLCKGAGNRLPILADENISPKTIEWLNHRGFYVMQAELLGLSRSYDRRILNCAIENGLVLLTHDSDFRNLRHHTTRRSAGVVILPGRGQNREDQGIELYISVALYHFARLAKKPKWLKDILLDYRFSHREGLVLHITYPSISGEALAKYKEVLAPTPIAVAVVRLRDASPTPQPPKDQPKSTHRLVGQPHSRLSSLRSGA